MVSTAANLSSILLTYNKQTTLYIYSSLFKLRVYLQCLSRGPTFWFFCQCWSSLFSLVRPVAFLWIRAVRVCRPCFEPHLPWTESLIWYLPFWKNAIKTRLIILTPAFVQSVEIQDGQINKHFSWSNKRGMEKTFGYLIVDHMTTLHNQS